MDGALTEIFGYLRPCIIGAEGLLVDVFFKNVAQYIRVDLIIISTRCVVEVPGISFKEAEEVFKGNIRDLDIRPSFFNRVYEEQTAVEVFDLAQEPDGLG